ncbi:MAG: Uncharacterised protein [Opitutia bacterium UBA7350]|nr:MAG: Uncharacterised protein [Opitutae bacterium UBA7350]
MAPNLHHFCGIWSGRDPQHTLGATWIQQFAIIHYNICGLIKFEGRPKKIEPL